MSTLPLYVPDVKQTPVAIELLAAINKIGLVEALSRINVVAIKDTVETPKESPVLMPKSKNGILYDAIVKRCSCYQCFNKVCHSSRIEWRYNSQVIQSKGGMRTRTVHVSHPILGAVILCHGTSDAIFRRLYEIRDISGGDFKDITLGYVYNKNNFNFNFPNKNKNVDSVNTKNNSKDFKNKKIKPKFLNVETISNTSNSTLIPSDSASNISHRTDKTDLEVKLDHQYRMKLSDNATKLQIARENITARDQKSKPKDPLTAYKEKEKVEAYKQEQARKKKEEEEAELQRANQETYWCYEDEW
jgi:hypothetical protein